MTRLRILSWNIRQGGGRRLVQIVDAIVRHAPDVVVLAECRRSTEPALIEAFATIGLADTISSNPESRENGLLVAARFALAREPATRPARLLPHSLLEVRLTDFAITIGAVYGPMVSPLHDRFWTAMVRHAKTRLAQRYLLIGDFNSGESLVDTERYRFTAGDRFLALRALGFVDAWRAEHSARREYSWYSFGRGNIQLNGFRLDHALASPVLAGELSSCRYSHVEREQRLSDHSILLVECEEARRAINTPDIS